MWCRPPSRKEGGSGQVILLNTEASQVGDVFDELDLYVEQGIPLEDYLDQIDTNKIAEDAKNSPEPGSWPPY